MSSTKFKSRWVTVNLVEERKDTEELITGLDKMQASLDAAKAIINELKCQ